MLKRLSVIVLIGILMFSFLPTNALGAAETVVTIFHTNDIHSRVNEGDGMGFAKIASIVSEAEGALLVDAGDVFHGQTFATLTAGESIAQLMNLVGYDYMAPGNHDFNYGYERLVELDGLTDFPILCANVKMNDEYILTPYEVKEVEGKKIGFFGLATPETLWKSHPDNTAGLTFIDPVEAAGDTVAALEAEGADLIVAIVHLGQDTSSTDTSIKVAQEVTGIDLMIDGHSHTSAADVVSTDNTVIVSANEYSKELGKVTITFTGNDIKIEVDHISKAEAAAITPNEEVTALISDITAEQDVILSEVIGSTSVALLGERGYVRTGETNLGNLITDAMRAASGAEVAITNGGGIRASIPAGEITKGDVITVLPFGNFIQLKRVTGQDIYDALEQGASDWPASKGAFPHVSGITYKIDGSKTALRIFDVIVNGEPLDMCRTYTLATNDFMAAGGDGYTMFGDATHLGDFDALDEVVIDYISNKEVVSPTTENRIVGINADSEPKDSEPASSTTDSTYTIQAGDVLWKIAESHNTTWIVLAELNGIANPGLIYPGQQIVLP